MCLQVEGEAVSPSHQPPLKKARTQEDSEASQPQGGFQMPSGPPGQHLTEQYHVIQQSGDIWQHDFLQGFQICLDHTPQLSNQSHDTSVCHELSKTCSGMQVTKFVCIILS